MSAILHQCLRLRLALTCVGLLGLSSPAFSFCPPPGPEVVVRCGTISCTEGKILLPNYRAGQCNYIPLVRDLTEEELKAVSHYTLNVYRQGAGDHYVKVESGGECGLEFYTGGRWSSFGAHRADGGQPELVAELMHECIDRISFSTAATDDWFYAEKLDALHHIVWQSYWHTYGLGTVFFGFMGLLSYFGFYRKHRKVEGLVVLVCISTLSLVTGNLVGLLVGILVYLVAGLSGYGLEQAYFRWRIGPSTLV